jgi:hypothetical protein
MFIPVIVAAAALQASAPEAVCVAESSSQSLIENVNQGVLLHLRIASRDSAGSTKDAGPDRDYRPRGSGYERLRIRFRPCLQGTAYTGSDRNYLGESRDWLKRLFARKLVGKVLKVSATVNPLGVDASKTLVTVTRDSGKSGDVWLTDIDNDMVLLPYFRTADNQTVRLDITFTSNRNYNVSAAGTAIDIVKRAAALISPAGSLVTSLNKAQFNEAADFVDRTIEGLLTVSIQEQVHTEGQLDGSSAPLVTMTLYAPWANDVFPKANHQMRPLGLWEVYADPLQGDSIFDLRRSGEEMSDYSAASILNFRVSDDKTLKESVTADSSVQQARDALLSAGEGQPTTDAAWAMCRAAGLRIDSLGFSAADTARGVWAYLTDLALPEKKRGPAATACSQLDHWPAPAEIAVAAGKAPTSVVSAGARKRAVRPSR